MRQPTMSCQQARQIDLVEYLAQLGYHPQKGHGGRSLVCSVPRSGKKNPPSFKVNQRLNILYDHAEGRGGDSN